MRRNKRTTVLALCGVLAALAVALLLITYVEPIAMGLDRLTGAVSI